MAELGHIQEDPCDCDESHNGTRWIVRHPDFIPPVSYGTETAAQEALNMMNEDDPEPHHISLNKLDTPCKWCGNLECDCQERIDCPVPGIPRHWGCGLCNNCKRPNFACNCIGY